MVPIIKENETDQVIQQSHTYEGRSNGYADDAVHSQANKERD